MNYRYQHYGLIKEAGILSKLKSIFQQTAKNTQPVDLSRRNFLKNSPFIAASTVMAANDVANSAVNKARNYVAQVASKATAHPVAKADRVRIGAAEIARKIGRVRKGIIEGKPINGSDAVVDRVIKPGINVIKPGINNVVQSKPVQAIAETPVGKYFTPSLTTEKEIYNKGKEARQFYIDNVDPVLSNIEKGLKDASDQPITRRQFLGMLADPNMRIALLPVANTAKTQAKILNKLTGDKISVNHGLSPLYGNAQKDGPNVMLQLMLK